MFRFFDKYKKLDGFREKSLDYSEKLLYAYCQDLRKGAHQYGGTK